MKKYDVKQQVECIKNNWDLVTFIMEELRSKTPVNPEKFWELLTWPLGTDAERLIQVGTLRTWSRTGETGIASPSIADFARAIRTAKFAKKIRVEDSSYWGDPYPFPNHDQLLFVSEVIFGCLNGKLRSVRNKTGATQTVSDVDEISSIHEMTAPHTDIEKWAETNHSKSDITCIDVEKVTQIDVINETISNEYDIPRIIKIETLEVEAASLNYKIITKTKNYLFRIYRRLDSEQLSELHERERYVFNEEIFKEKIGVLDAIKRRGDVKYRYGDFDRKKTKIFKSKIFLGYNRYYLYALYPFANNVQHFDSLNSSGKLSENDVDIQLTSLAEKYGELQRLLLNSDGRFDRGIFRDLETQGIIGRIARTYENLEDRIENEKDHPFAGWWRRHKAKIKLACDEYKIHVASVKFDEQPVVLYDLHPHNSFFSKKTKKCIVIFDYEAFTKETNESNAFALTIHRYIREYIRIRKPHENELEDEEVRKIIREKVEKMTSAYIEAGGKLEDNFLETLSSRIKAVNVGKLLIILSYATGRVDKAHRSHTTLDNEMIKFIRYIYEADYF